MKIESITCVMCPKSGKYESTWVGPCSDCEHLNWLVPNEYVDCNHPKKGEHKRRKERARMVKKEKDGEE